MIKQAFAVLLGVLVMGMGTTALAQQDNGNNGGNNGNNNNGGGNRPGRGNFDPAQFRQRMMDDLKQRLDAKDDEWAAIQPKLEKVMTLSRDARGGGFGFGGNRPGRNRGDQGGGNTPTQADSAVSRAQTELQSALDDKTISADEIAKRLATLRSAKDQSKQDLVKAQQDLKELLTQRQEAVLVLRGMMD